MTSHSDTQDREIITERLIDAPRTRVWEVWTDASHIDKWWGPTGFRNETFEMSVQPGGVWRFMMHGPDGIDYPNRIVYEEVVKPEKLVYAHSSDEENPTTHFHVTVTFEEVGEKTKLTMRAVFPTAAMRNERIEKSGAIEGAKQTLNRLEEYLAR